MRRGRFEPGARCIVIGEHRGYECNIGALVTLTEKFDGVNVFNQPLSAWRFKEASRPLLMAKFPDAYVVDSTPWVNCGQALSATYPESHLLPIGGEDLANARDEEKERRAETSAV